MNDGLSESCSSLTDEAFLGELDGEPPGDFLQLVVLKQTNVSL